MANRNTVRLFEVSRIRIGRNAFEGFGAIEKAAWIAGNRSLLVVAVRQANLSAKANQNQETSAASQINFPSRTGRFGTGFQQPRSERAKERKQYVYLTFVLYLAPIIGQSTIEDIPEGLNGVRIHASSNAIVTLLGDKTSKSVCIKGSLTDEGVECQALRGENGELYTLVGNLGEFRNGDQVIVCGTIADISFCQQGTTINLSSIGVEIPHAR